MLNRKYWTERHKENTQLNIIPTDNQQEIWLNSYSPEFIVINQSSFLEKMLKWIYIIILFLSTFFGFISLGISFDLFLFKNNVQIKLYFTKSVVELLDNKEKQLFFFWCCSYLTLFTLLYRNFIMLYTWMFGIMVIILGNEIGNPSSNPVWGCLHFTLH